MRTIGHFVILATLAATTQIAALAGDKGGQIPLARVSQSTTNRTLLNINELAAWIHSNGLLARDPRGNSGLFFPRGSNPSTAVGFQDQLIWGGQVSDGQEPVLRVGGGQRSVGHVPGKILSPGIPEDRTDPNINRVWRIRRDFATAALALDAAEINSILPQAVSQNQIDDVRAIYRQDWIDWPEGRGAPFYDADGDGHYRPAFNPDGTPKLAPRNGEAFDPAIHADEPGFADGDQVVWLVANDLNRGALENFSGSPPIGMEMQLTLWGYAREGVINHTIFRRHRLIYKGTELTPSSASIDSFYIAQWADPDVGGAGDDLVGCNTQLDLAFAYNASNTDRVYTSVALAPPAVGHLLLAGPVVESSGSEAVYNMRPLMDYQNLAMTSFQERTCRSYECDNNAGTYHVTLQLFNMLRGFLPRPVTPLTPSIDPTTGVATKFVLSGDPITQMGWVDSGGGDRRFLLSSGPVSMAVGDTQEVTIAVVAGIGSDRLSSFAVMRLNAAKTKQLFDNLLQLAQPPPAVKATKLDGQILLNWGWDHEQLARTENQGRELPFEGYNVYQLPTAGAALAEGVKLATFDSKNDIAAIVQPAFDPASGMVLDQLVQAGSNSGIFRTFLATRDSLNSEPIYSGQIYHFAVTAYLVHPDRSQLIRALESEPVVVTVKPQASAPGTRLNSAMGDTITAELVQGDSDGLVQAIVVDPTEVSGDDYRVVFAEVDKVNAYGDTTGVIEWALVNTSKGETLLNHQSNQSGDENYLLTDGPQVKVVAPVTSATPNRPGVVFAFSTAGFEPSFSRQHAQEDVPKINVFPNPYYGMFRFEGRFSGRFVTFNHLPEKATIRIFTLAGNLVRTLEKQDPGQFLRWDLTNDYNWIVGGGIYVAHVEMSELGASKVLKLAVIP